MEKIEFRSAVAVALAGIPPLEYHKLRKITGRENTGRVSKADYTPDDVRLLKRQFLPGFAEWQDSIKHVPVIATRMSKGGVGKSTLTTNAAIAAAMRGYRVLAIDLDPQASMTELFGVDSEVEDLRTIVSCVIDSLPLAECVYSMSNEATLHLLPADQLVGRFDDRTNGEFQRELLLRRWLESEADVIRSNYDVIFMDTGPGPSKLNINALIAADLIVAPMITEGMSQKALKLLRTEVEDIQHGLNESKPVLFVANGYNKMQTHSRDGLAKMVRAFGESLAKSIIPNNVGVARQIIGNLARPVILAEPTKPAAVALHNVTREILELVNLFGVDPAPEIESNSENE